MNRLRTLLLGSCCFLLMGIGPNGLYAQHTRDVPGVQAALSSFFEALNKGNARQMKPLLADSLELVSISERRGEPNLRVVQAHEFVEAVGKPREQAWLEVTRNVRVNLDGFLAQAWMDYSFFLGDNLHHCGVNNMTLFYDGEKWVIIGLVDTQRKLNCQ